jgi:DNA-binding response OmpR family regulator
MTILIAEDDARTRAGLEEVFRAEGFETLVATNGREAVDLHRSRQPDVVCLDIMMPGMSGYDVCREIRRQSDTVPVLFISAKSEEIDTVLGLELGADDFITKPFGVREVVARVRAVVRRVAAAGRQGRAEPASREPFTLGDLRVVPQELRAYRGERAIELSPRDVRLLVTFHSNAGKVLDRDTLFDVGWGARYLPSSRTLDQHISQLRKRIEVDPRRPRIILTVHTAGYRCEG